MILNLIGPPAAGKTTFASRFILDHPYFTFCSIHRLRLQYREEELAWAKMTEEVMENKDVIIETCGMNYRLLRIFRLPTIRNRPVVTVLFNNSKGILVQRLGERKKRSLPPDREWHRVYETDAICQIGDKLLSPQNSRLPVNISYLISFKPQKVYEEVNKQILYLCTDIGARLKNPKLNLKLKDTCLGKFSTY